MMTVKKGACHCDVSEQIAEIRGLLNILIAKVQSLRQERLPADPEDIEALLAAIYRIFQDDVTTAFFIFDECTSNNSDARRLQTAMSKCLKGKLTIRRLSFFLSKNCDGRYGPYTLQYCGKQRDGHLYRVTK